MGSADFISLQWALEVQMQRVPNFSSWLWWTVQPQAPPQVEDGCSFPHLHILLYGRIPSLHLITRSCWHTHIFSWVDACFTYDGWKLCVHFFLMLKPVLFWKAKRLLLVFSPLSTASSSATLSCMSSYFNLSMWHKHSAANQIDVYVPEMGGCLWEDGWLSLKYIFFRSDTCEKVIFERILRSESERLKGKVQGR